VFARIVQLALQLGCLPSEPDRNRIRALFGSERRTQHGFQHRGRRFDSFLTRHGLVQKAALVIRIDEIRVRFPAGPRRTKHHGDALGLYPRGAVRFRRPALSRGVPHGGATAFQADRREFDSRTPLLLAAHSEGDELAVPPRDCGIDTRGPLEMTPRSSGRRRLQNGAVRGGSGRRLRVTRREPPILRVRPGGSRRGSSKPAVSFRLRAGAQNLSARADPGQALRRPVSRFDSAPRDHLPAGGIRRARYERASRTFDSFSGDCRGVKRLPRLAHNQETPAVRLPGSATATRSSDPARFICERAPRQHRP
jgi:hypothetical protein